MAKYTFEQLKETLPSEIFDHYYSSELSDLYAAVIHPLLDDAQIASVKDLVQDVYFLALTPEDFLDQLDVLVPDESKFTTIALNILSKDFLPVADYLDADILGLIAAIGADPNVYRWKVPARDVVAQVLRNADITIEDDHLFTRLVRVLESRVLNARTEEQTVGLLTGPTKTSGVGLDEVQARSLLLLTSEEAAKLQKGGVQILSNEEYYQEEETEEAAEGAEEAGAAEAEEAAAETGMGAGAVELGAAEAGAPAGTASEEAAERKSEEEITQEVDEIVAEPIAAEPTTSAPATMQTIQPADIQDVRQAAAMLEENVDAGKIQTEADLMTGLVEEAIAVAGVKFDNEDMHRRFLNIVNLYFRDLRDALETKSKMTMPVASGGMGMSDDETDRVMSVLEMKVGEYHQLMAGKATQNKQQYVAARAEQVTQQAENQTQKEQAALDTMFSKLVVRTGAPAPVIPPAAIGPAAIPAPQPEPSKPKFIQVIAAESKPVESRPVEAAPAVKSVRAEEPAIVAATAPPPVKLPEILPPLPPAIAKTAVSAKVAEVLKRAAELPPAPEPVAPPPPPPPLQPRAVVADIRYVPKLTGPVDELRALALKDFRRLSRDPHEATLKIRDKIDLLADQSFEVKSAGIKAWQDSETNRLYLAMLRSSLEGKPIMDVIVEKEAKGEPVLSKAEFDAIMELNRKLRFG